MSEVYIFLTDNFEEIEGLTVVDMLRRAGISITTVSITGNLEVTGSHNITVKADALYEDCKDMDFDGAEMLVLPGGPGTDDLAEFAPLCELLLGFNAKKKYIAAICAAPTVLGKLGILKGKKATCFSGLEKQLTGAEFSPERCVAHENIITSRGMGTTIDFSAAIITALRGEKAAEEIKEKIMYYA